MKIGLNLSFKLGSVDGIYFINFFDKFIKFPPTSFSCGYEREPWSNESRIVMAGAESADRIYASNVDHNQFFSATQTGTNTPHNSISVVQEKNIFFPFDADIEKAIDKSGFVSAYLFNADYVEVQSTVFSNELEGCGLSLTSIADTPYTVDDMGIKEYDISKNPGRELLIGGTWLISAWKMWFGIPFFEFVPKERIMSFPGALEIKELSNGIVYVHLFNDLESSDRPENMKTQKHWCEWLDFEGLERKFD